MLLIHDFRMYHSDSNCSIPTAGCATRIKMKMALNSKFPDQQIRTETQGFCCFFSRMQWRKLKENLKASRHKIQEKTCYCT